MNLDVPHVRTAPRSVRSKVGHFVSDVGYDGFADFLDAYRAGMAQLPPFDAQTDVVTTFGSVRIYRFDGRSAAPPVLLLPGRNASTPMWRANLAPIIAQRTVYSVDLLGEAGFSVQERPITSADEQAQWLAEAVEALGLDRVHVMGASIGGWTAVNWAVRRPGRLASLALLDPVFTFARIPLRTLLFSAAMVSPRVPQRIRQSFLRWVSGGAAVDDSVPEARLIAAAMVDYVLRLPPPKAITDDQLRGLDVPVLAFLGGRSVMLDAAKAAQRARTLLPHGQIEVYPEASHAINGEYAGEIAERAQRFWDAVDA